MGNIKKYGIREILEDIKELMDSDHALDVGFGQPEGNLEGGLEIISTSPGEAVAEIIIHEYDEEKDEETSISFILNIKVKEKRII